MHETIAQCSFLQRFDAVGDVRKTHIAVSVDALPSAFRIQSAEERLHHRVVPTVCSATPTRPESNVSAEHCQLSIPYREPSLE
ncbi:MAG TPA: hypothetical protein VMT92_01010 [Steroidobacteraceae bacterium]|nr:hypothetical protein [Steroidobacteraceae bacterium]